MLQLRTLLTDPVVNNLSLTAKAMSTLRILFTDGLVEMKQCLANLHH
jgi:hypothetical protein